MPRSVEERGNLDRVRRAMKQFGYERGWSHEEFASRLNISRRHLEYVFSGERDLSAEVLMSFCLLLGSEGRERLFQSLRLPTSGPLAAHSPDPVISLA